jgi:hypothetical protein
VPQCQIAAICHKVLKLMENSLPMICLLAVLLLIAIQAGVFGDSVQDFEEEQDLWHE